MAGVACAALTVPAAAQAATRAVTMGPPKAAVAVLNKTYGADVNDFFPHKTTIHVGDSIRFVPVGFHTVDIPKKGGEPLPFATPGAPVSGAVDALGVPFWFNGQPSLGFNPALAPPNLKFGRSLSYGGNTRVTSGLPVVQRPKPMTVFFRKTGTYDYYCNIHPGMEGTVKVVGTKATIPTRQQHLAAVRKQITRDTNTAKTLATATPPAGTVYVGNSGSGGVEYFGMVPATTTVPTGTTLKFMMSPKSFEDHTASFGPGDPENDPASYLGQIAAGFNAPQFDPRAVYPSEAPGTIGTLTPALHGNGFWNTGVMDAASATPLPDSGTVTFGAPGTYTFYCLIHTFMKGTVVVQ